MSIEVCPMFTVQLPKILCLALVISKYAKDVKYFNTNDLIEIANAKKSEMVRLRKDKASYEYRYFEDTNFGGLRGNFSTVLTLCGLIQRKNRITGYYSIGPGERLINAVNKGDIILDRNDFIATTNSLDLKIMLENEARYLSIREAQAHIKVFLKNNPLFPLKRDNVNFKKICVLKSTSNQYFYRILFNTYAKPNVIEYNMLSYLEGPKIKRQNIHALFVVPNQDDYWGEFYVIDSKYLLQRAPLFLYFDTSRRVVYDKAGNTYPFESLSASLSHISDENGNSVKRLSYDPQKALERLVTRRVSASSTTTTETEESVFIKNFLSNSLNNKLFIKGKLTKEYKIHRAGVDVTIDFVDGTTQPLELEHKWSNYVSHGHQNSIAWKDAWIYANEKFDFTKIKMIFGPYKGLYIPSVFLSSNPSTGSKEAYEVDWNTDTFTKLLIEFR